MVRALHTAEPLTARALHAYLSRLFADRRIDAFEAVCSDDSLGHEDVLAFHRARLRLYRGQEVDVSHLERLQMRTRGMFLGRAMTNLLLEQTIRTGGTDAVARRLAVLSDSEVRELSPIVAMGVYRSFVASGDRLRARTFLESHLAGAPLHREFYFAEAARELGLPTAVGEVRDWRSLARRVGELYPAADTDDASAFQRTIVEPLLSLPRGERDAMDLRFEERQRAEMLATFRRRLEQGFPLSLVRLGDGEAYAYRHPSLPRLEQDAFVADDQRRERMWWGETPAPGVAAAIKEGVRSAVAASDIIGVPSIYRVVRDLAGRERRFGRTASERGLLVVLSMLGSEIPLDRAVFTEERCNQVLFDRDTLRDLADAASRVVFVGCWPEERLSLGTKRGMHVLLTAPHTRVRDAAWQPDTPEPLHRTYPAIAEQVEQLAGPGVLVLVAAGIIGKLFVESARQAGAVALDIGAVADYLAGQQTRSVADVV